MEHNLPLDIDLSRGRSAESFFVPLIPDRFGIEAWRADQSCFDLHIPHNSWCAITTLRMALLLEGMEAPSQEELFEDACKHGVYKWQEGKGWIGAYHAEFASFLYRHGFLGHFVQGLSPDDVASTLARGIYCILRVSPAIRFLDTVEPEKKVGHVVLCFGYRTKEDGRYFRIHNCAGFASLNSQIDFPVHESRLKQVFSGDATVFRRHS